MADHPINNAKSLALASLAPITFPIAFVLGWTLRHYAQLAWQGGHIDLLYSLMFALAPLGITFGLGCATLITSAIRPMSFTLRGTLLLHLVPLMIGGLSYYAPIF